MSFIKDRYRTGVMDLEGSRGCGGYDQNTLDKVFKELIKLKKSRSMSIQVFLSDLHTSPPQHSRRES